MGKQQPDELFARITGCADNCDFFQTKGSPLAVRPWPDCQDGSLWLRPKPP
jgi:hypothetical protein